jgi:DNA-binding NarL/FixJ family response regulator
MGGPIVLLYSARHPGHAAGLVVQSGFARFPIPRLVEGFRRVAGDRKRREARDHLRAAMAAFEQLGAASWEERARNELRATGVTARKRDASTLGDLTSQELQIARLVAGGARNGEVATQLFLSPRTIDYHLRKVFMKLGIASRAELAQMAFASVA